MAGILATCESVSGQDIAGLMDRFIKQGSKLSYQVDEDKAYEVHNEEERTPKMQIF